MLALCDGTLPPFSKPEFISRLQHLVNIYDIVCLNSALSSFNDASWTEGLEYDSCILQDIQTGVKEWSTFSCSIDPTCWQMVRQLSNSEDFNNLSSDSDLASKKFTSYNYAPEGGVLKKCTSCNSFSKYGCQYKFLNPEKKCKFVHSCSICDAHGNFDMPHKAFECEEYFDYSHELNSYLTDLGD